MKSSSLVALAHSMRLSLLKAACAVVSVAAYGESGSQGRTSNLLLYFQANS
jgi:hypothetical protein